MNGSKNCGRISSEIYFSLKKRNPALSNGINEFLKHHAKQNKPVTEEQILHDSTSMRYIK